MEHKIKVRKRTFQEMVEYFIDQVAFMKIDERYKLELVGMITVIQTEYEEEKKTWSK